jgi:short-subunit dehydrogenase
MHNKRIALVTGANQGVGLQVATELVANGLTVLVGSRNFERGQAAAAGIGAGAIPLQLDVTDRASIVAADGRAGVDRDKINLVSPGFAKTNLNGYEGLESVEDGSREVVRVAMLSSDGPTGTFTRWQNETIPW